MFNKKYNSNITKIILTTISLSLIAFAITSCSSNKTADATTNTNETTISNQTNTPSQNGEAPNPNGERPGEPPAPNSGRPGKPRVRRRFAEILHGRIQRRAQIMPAHDHDLAQFRRPTPGRHSDSQHAQPFLHVLFLLAIRHNNKSPSEGASPWWPGAGSNR